MHSQQKFFNSMSLNSAAIFFSHPLSASGTCGWPGAFIQEPNFWYLLPFKEPGCALVFYKDGKRGQQKFLFCCEKNIDFERWHGKRLGPEQAQQRYPDFKVYAYGELETFFSKLLKTLDLLYYGWGLVAEYDAWIIDFLRKRETLQNFSMAVQDCRALLQTLRVIKDEHECDAIQQACRITAAAFERVAKKVNHYANECEIQAELYATFSEKGASPAYPAIVASGSRGLCLHYCENNHPLKEHESILIDAGCRYQGYASDVSRTLFKGQPTKAWKRLYGLVKSVQEQIIQAIQPGCKFFELQERARRLFAQGLSQIESWPFRSRLMDDLNTFYPHSLGHWIGIEVHDLGPSLRSREDGLMEGMVLTVEPGLYIPDLESYGEFAGLCIRIEDVIGVTPQGHENYTSMIDK